MIEDIETRSPVELIAIGIGHDVTRYYRRAVTIVDAEELGGAMTEKLAELFAEHAGEAHRARLGRAGCTPDAVPRLRAPVKYLFYVAGVRLADANISRSTGDFMPPRVSSRILALDLERPGRKLAVLGGQKESVEPAAMVDGLERVGRNAQAHRAAECSDISVTLSRLGRNRRLVLRFEWLTRCPIWRVFPVSSQRHDMANNSSHSPRVQRRATDDVGGRLRGPIVSALESVQQRRRDRHRPGFSPCAKRARKSQKRRIFRTTRMRRPAGYVDAWRTGHRDLRRPSLPG